MVSVIVVTYNQEGTIARTLDSILSQKFDGPFEIVVGDDCSSDRTSDICRDYAARFPKIIRYFRRDRNLGVVRNYFQCLADCRGKFVADCAGDDFWVDRYKLKKQRDLLLSNPAISIVHTAWNSCAPDGSNPQPGLSRDVRARIPAISLKGTSVGAILGRKPEATIHLCSAMYRKSLIDREIEDHPELFVSDDYSCEDLQIIVAMAARGSVAYLPEVTLYYSVAPDSVSHQTDFRKKYRQVRGNLILTERLRQHFGIDPAVVADYYSRTADYLEAQVFHAGDEALLADSRELIASLPIEGKRSRKGALRRGLMGNPSLWKLSRRLFGKKESR